METDGDAFFDGLYGQFCLHFPCYALRRPTGGGFAVEPAADGTASVVVLTDDDLVRRYHADRGLGRHLRVVLTGPAALGRLLDRLPRGVTHVTFDPAERHHRRYPVEVIRECVAPTATDAHDAA